VVQFDDGSNERTVPFEDLIAKMGRGHCVKVIGSNPLSGQTGYIEEENPKDDTVMGVVFEGARTPQWIPVNDLQIVPKSRQITNNMLAAGNSQQQPTPEECQAMLANQQRGDMSMGAKIALLVLVAILIVGMLGGLYLYLGGDDEEDRRRESSFIDLEAGRGPPRMSRRGSRKPKPQYLSGQELDRAADRQRSRRSRRRKIDREVSRRSHRRSRNASRSASRRGPARRSRDERRPRGDRSRSRRSQMGGRSSRRHSARSPHVVVDMSGARQN